MARTPLPLGTWGEIRTHPGARNDKGQPTSYRAVTTYRDYDGSTRQVERRGPTRTKAVANLKKALNELPSQGGGELASTDRFERALDMWFDKLAELVADGRRSPGTLDTYRRVATKHVRPALKELRLGEMKTPVVDRFIGRIKREVGGPTAKTCRAIVSGVMSLAVRYGAVAVNPVRDVEAVEVTPKKKPRALVRDERIALLARLETNERAIRADLVDLACFMLATGVRIGEALAVLCGELDRKTCLVQVTSTIIRVKGVGLIRRRTKSRAGQRPLLLPRWAMERLDVRLGEDPDPEDPLFSHSRGVGWRDPSNVHRAFREVLSASDFAWITTHVFRKTTATMLDDAGLSPRVVADQLGHARPSLTQDVYLARNTVHPEAASALEDVFGASGKPMA